MTQAVNLANFANNLDSSGGVTPSALNAVVPVSKGGTNAATASAARTSLGVDYTTLQSAVGTLLYPVGSLYFNATDSTNPGTLLGFGTWVAFGAGRVPVGFNAADPLFDTAEKTGGSKDAIVVSHSHTATDSGHTHNISQIRWSNSNGFTNSSGSGAGTSNSFTPATDSGTANISVSTTGSSGTNANLQPYITVYIWKRTA